VPKTELAIMHRLDRLHLEYPFAGSRMLRGLLWASMVIDSRHDSTRRLNQSSTTVNWQPRSALRRLKMHWLVTGSRTYSTQIRGWLCKIGRRHVRTLMRRLGIEALCRRPRTTTPEPGHKIHPYLLRSIEITRPNQVWAMDITYIPMARGFVYLAGAAFTGVLADRGITISMDGKGAWRDNVFVERLWRSIKYEEVYLRAYESVGEARSCIGRYLDFYNGKRPHRSLDDATPDQAYFTKLPLRVAA
jgi:putative transposase